MTTPHFPQTVGMYAVVYRPNGKPTGLGWADLGTTLERAIESYEMVLAGARPGEELRLIEVQVPVALAKAERQVTHDYFMSLLEHDTPETYPAIRQDTVPQPLLSHLEMD